MKGKAKRVLSFCLAVLITVTSIGYTSPPFSVSASTRMEEALKALASPSEATKDVTEDVIEDVTEDVAEDVTEMATPSEAEKPGDKATPSEAVRKFIQVEPEEIPEYYSQVKKAGKRFWKFEDRNGMIQYRDYGYVDGEAEFPLWYEADSQGYIAEEINEGDEYYELAPYLYKSAAPTKTSWANLSWKLLNDSESIFLFDRKESGSFKNWDHSTYDIWSVNEKEGDEFQNTDLGYFFYGQILNESDSVEQWYYADLNGSIWPMKQYKTMMLMAEAPTTCKLTFDANGGTIYNSSTYEKDLTINTAMTYADMNTIKSNMKRVGYTFNGWNYQPDGSGSNFYDSTKVTSDTTIYAKWRKDKFTVYFYRNYPIGDTQTKNYKDVYYGDPISSFPDPFPVGLGMEFKGWYLNKYCSGDPVTVDMLMPGETLNLYGKWESFDATYKMHYGYGIDESTLPTEIKARSTVVGTDLAKYYFPDLVNSSKLYAPGYVDGYWSDKSDMNSGAVIWPDAQPTWYPKNHITDIYLKKAKKRVVFDLYYPPYDYPKNQYSSSSWPIGGVGTTNYGDIISPKDLSDIMVYVRSGKKFVGLFTDPEQKNEIDLSKPICPPDKQDKKDLIRYTVYLGIANESSKITFKDWDGSIISEKIVNYGDPIEIPPAPSRSGYRFLGWDKEINESTKIGIDTEITAQYVESGFRINLYANGGKFKEINNETGSVDLYDSKTIKFEDITDGKYVVEKSNEFLNDQLKNLKREGYLYDLYDSQTGGNLITSITESNLLNGKVDIYAQWTSAYLVTFKDWDGNIINEQYVKRNQNAIPPEDPKRDGYAFTGWSIPYNSITSNLTITANYETLLKIRFLRCNYNQANTSDEFNSEEVINAGVYPTSYNDTVAEKLWDIKANLEKVKFPNLENEGDIFLGWARDGEINSHISFKDHVPQMLRRPIAITQTVPGGVSTCYATNNTYGNVVPGFAIIPGGTEVESRVFMGPNSNYHPDRVYKGVWVPEDKPSLILVNGFKDYYGGFGFRFVDETKFSKYSLKIIENAEMVESISIAQNFGDKFTDLKLMDVGTSDIGIPKALTGFYEGNGVSNSNTTYYDIRKLIGYFSEPDGKGKRLDNNYIFNKVADKYYAYFVPKDQKFDFTFKDEYGNVISSGKMNADGKIINLPQAPQKPGYIFIGWKDSSGCNSTTNSVLRDTDFIPVYEKVIQNYTLTLDGNGGTLAGSSKKEIKVPFEQVIDQALNDGKDMVERLRYHFDGWYTDPTGGNKYPESGNKMPDTDLTIYAHWTRSSSEVVFKDWNGSVLDKQDVAIGADALPPTPPERDMYEFTGWDYPTTNILHDLVLTAQYKIKTFAVPVDADGGSVAGIENFVFTGLFDITPSEIDELMRKFLLDNATKEGFKLVGFEYSDSTTGGVRKKGFPTKIPLTNDLKIYLIWAKETFQVTYKDWNETIIDNQEVIIGEDALPPKAPDRPGYTFTGWDKSSNNIHANTIITAQYTINSYKLTLVGNGGTLTGEETKSQSIDFGESLDQIFVNEKNGAARNYYTFTGWYTAPSGGSKYPESGNLMPNADLIVFAHWERSSSEVVFKDWNGTTLDTQEVPVGGNAIPPAPPQRLGYTFSGWDKPYTNIQDHSTLTALYTRNSYKLTLNGNGGTLAEEETKDQVFDYGDSFDHVLINGKADAARRFYTFTGWYTAPSGGSKYPESGNLMPDAEVTAYAHWERSSSEVIFKDWNGMTLEKQEVAIGANATPPEVPERQGYTFNGWDKSYSNIQDHSTITAQYTINGYLLTLDGNGGTLEGNIKKEQVLSFDQSFDQALKDGRDLVSRSGYSFDGWYNSASGGSNYSYSGNQMPAANVTLFAHWSPNTYKVTFDPDHVRWDGEATIEEHTFDTRLGILPMPEIYGWKFTGWWTGKNGTGTEVTNDSMVEPKDVVYYGKWQPEAYQIRFISKAEQPEGESVQAFTVGLRYDQEFGNLPVPEEKGYTFMGWYDENNKKVDSQTIFNPDSDAEAKTYYAGWKGKTYQIRFVYNDSDGKPVVKIIDGTYGMQIGTLPSPEKPGYTFTGWFRDNGEEVTSGSWVEPGDTEYKAKWIPNKYTIHFKSNLDSMNDPEDKIVTYALPIGDLPLLHATGYAFLGWYTESSGGSLIKETTLAALGDQTYYGHWSTGLIDNGNGTYRRPGSDGKWNTADDELWWYGPDGIIDTEDDRQIYLMPGGNGYYIDNGNGTYTKPGSDGSWTNGTETWVYGPGGKPGADDRQIHVMPGGNGYYIDNGDGTYIKPGPGGSWTNGTETWVYGPDGKPGTSDDYKKGDNGNTDPDPVKPDPVDPDPVKPDPVKPDPVNPSKPESSIETKDDSKEVVTPTEIPLIDSTSKPSVKDDGGSFKVNPENPKDVTYIKSDGTPANNEWVGDGTNLYHVDEESKLNYDWFLENENTWFMLNNKSGENFGAALRGWYSEPMDNKKYFFDPGTTKMLTGWQLIDNKMYYFTEKNDRQTYTGDNKNSWKANLEIVNNPLSLTDRPYGSMYRNEYTPDGHWVDENGVCSKYVKK